jgi:hypothetical protein
MPGAVQVEITNKEMFLTAFICIPSSTIRVEGTGRERQMTFAGRTLVGGRLAEQTPLPLRPDTDSMLRVQYASLELPPPYNTTQLPACLY